MRAGVEQGSLISLVLFSLYVNDVPTPSHHVELTNRPRDFDLLFVQVFSLIYRSSAAVILWHLQTNNSQ